LIVIADASPLIALSSLGCLSLLQERFPDGLTVPPAVWREVVEEGRGRSGADAVRAADWIRVQEVEDRDYIRLLQSSLDEGEAETIALAHERHADVVLLDEKTARMAAEQLGLRVLGVVGILIWARRSGRVKNLRQELIRIRDELGFRLSQRVVEMALQQVGEGEQ
jgi:predicted nucleic acid-binding protein